MVESMGPTRFLPRTHTEEAHTRYVWEQPLPWGHDAPQAADESEFAELLRHSAVRVPLLRCGDCVIFDSRLLHCAGANRSPTRRVTFYFSLKARDAMPPPGTLFERLRGRYRLDASHQALEEVAESPGARATDREGPSWDFWRTWVAQARGCDRIESVSSVPQHPPYVGFPRMRVPGR